MLDNILGSPIVHGEIENKVKFNNEKQSLQLIVTILEITVYKILEWIELK
jgi:hypothetical protein